MKMAESAVVSVDHENINDTVISVAYDAQKHAETKLSCNFSETTSNNVELANENSSALDPVDALEQIAGSGNECIDSETEQFDDSFLLGHCDLHLCNVRDPSMKKPLLIHNDEFDHAVKTMKRPLNGEHSSEAQETCLTSWGENDVSGSHYKQEMCVGSGTDSPTFTPPTRLELATVDKASSLEKLLREGDVHLVCSMDDEGVENEPPSCSINHLFQKEYEGCKEEPGLVLLNSEYAHSELPKLKALEEDSHSKNDTAAIVLSDDKECTVVGGDGLCFKKMPSGLHSTAVNELGLQVSFDRSENSDEQSKGIIGHDGQAFHLTHGKAPNDVDSACCQDQWNFESWLSHLPYTSDQKGFQDVDDLWESATSFLPKKSNDDADDLSFTKEDASVIAALGTTFHSDIFGQHESSTDTQPEDDAQMISHDDSTDDLLYSQQTKSNAICIGTSPNVSWVSQRFVHESSITPDSLENFQQSELEHLTSWQNSRSSFQQTHFKIRTNPASYKQPLEVSSVIEDPWGASSDSITFVFVGPNLPQTGKSSSDPSAVLRYMEHFDDPGALMLRSASLDCINRRPKCFGMLPYTLNTRASSMESMIPEDLMGVVERGRIHEIGPERTSKEHIAFISQHPKSTPSKAYSQNSVIVEKPSKRTKKSVSWGDLSGCGLTVEESGKQRSMTMPSPFLLKPIIKKSGSKTAVLSADDDFEKTEKQDYTDDDVEKDLKSSALYARIHKKCQLATGQAAVPPPLPSFKLQLPAHVKARMNQSKSETMSPSTSAIDEKSEELKKELCENVSTETLYSDEPDRQVHKRKPPVLESQNENIPLPSMLAPFVSVVENLLSSKEAAAISAKAVALQNKSPICNTKDLSAFLMETSNFFQQLSLICDQNCSNMLNPISSAGSVVAEAATQTDQVEKTSVATNTEGKTEANSFVGQQSDCILTSLDNKQVFQIFSPVSKHGPSSASCESVLHLQCCSPSDFHNITCSSNIQNENRQPFSASLSSIPQMDSDSASGSPSSSVSAGRAVQVNTLFPRTSSKRSWMRREACLRKELEILSKEKENVLSQLENHFGSGGDESPPSLGSPDSPLYLFTYHDRLQKACARIAIKLEKLAHLRASENMETLSALNSWRSFPETDGSSLSISSSDYMPLHQDVAPNNFLLSNGSSPLNQLSGSSISSINTCGSEPQRLRPRDYRAQLVNFRRNLVKATTNNSGSHTPKIKGTRRTSSTSSHASNCVDGNSSAEDIQALLHECRVARAKAQREIELAHQQLTAQRSAVKSLESVMRHRTS